MEREREKLLTRMTDFIKEVADCVNSPNPSLEVHRLVHYCRIGSIEGAVSKSYEQSFAAFHAWATRTAVFASLPHLPTRVKLMKNLKENGHISIYGRL